jgi:hypothetical protein
MLHRWAVATFSTFSSLRGLDCDRAFDVVKLQGCWGYLAVQLQLCLCFDPLLTICSMMVDVKHIVMSQEDLRELVDTTIIGTL